MSGYLTDRDIKNYALPPEKGGVAVYNDSGGALAAGTLVYVSGWTTTASGLANIRAVKKADADGSAPANIATYVVTQAIAAGGYGRVARAALVSNIDTSGVSAAGDPVYLSTTAGAFTATAPSTAVSNVQRVGYAITKNASTGKVAFDLTAIPEVLSNGALQDGSIYGAKAAVGAVVAGATALLASNMAIEGAIVVDVPDGASGNIDVTGLPFKISIIGVTYIKTGGAGNAGNSITVHNGTTGNAITDALNSATDAAVVYAGTLDDAYVAIAAAATIRFVTVRAGGNNAARIILHYIRVA